MKLTLILFIFLVFVQIREVDLITEQHQPLVQRNGRQDHTVGGLAVLAIRIECLEQQLRCGGTVEVENHHFQVGTEAYQRALKRTMILPDPGGLQSISGLCSASQVYSRALWCTVLMVGMITLGDATLSPLPTQAYPRPIQTFPGLSKPPPVSFTTKKLGVGILLNKL